MSHLLKSPLFWAVCLMLPGARAELPAGEPPREVFLELGEQRPLSVPKLRRYSLSGTAVRVLPPGPSGQETLLLKAASAGHATLLTFAGALHSGSPSAYLITVRAPDPTSERGPAPELLRALGRLREAEIQSTAGGYVLRGKANSPDEWRAVGSIVRRFPEAVASQVQRSSALEQAMLDSLRQTVRDAAAGRSLRVDAVGGRFWVRGSFRKASSRATLERDLRAIDPLVEFDWSSLPDDAPTVFFKVFLLELKKNRFSTLGLSWPGIQESAFRVMTGKIQDLMSLDLALNLLAGDGSAKLLSNPELVVRAPGDAELFSGGELPITVRNQYFSDTTWKTFGLLLKLHVTHCTDDRVRLDLSTEVSDIDLTIPSDSKIPGLSANRMRTQVDARLGQPLFLSGLLQRRTRDTARGLPWLREIPVLGALFGSEDYLDARSELVAILLPEAAPPPAPLDRFGEGALHVPRGPMPLPREPMSPEVERHLRSHPDYPWNVLE